MECLFLLTKVRNFSFSVRTDGSRRGRHTHAHNFEITVEVTEIVTAAPVWAGVLHPEEGVVGGSTGGRGAPGRSPGEGSGDGASTPADLSAQHVLREG